MRWFCERTGEPLDRRDEEDGGCVWHLLRQRILSMEAKIGNVPEYNGTN